MQTKRSQFPKPLSQQTSITMPVTSDAVKYNETLKSHSEDPKPNFNTPKSNDHATMYHSDSPSSSLVEDDDHQYSSKKASCSSSGNSLSVFESTSINDDHRYSNDLLTTSSTHQHSNSRTSSSDSSFVADIIEIDKYHLDESEETLSKTPASTDKSNTEEHSYNNHHQKNTHQLNNKKKNQFKKRSLGAKEPSKEKGRLNTFSKVNSMKDSTQRPNKKKVTAIVPGESLSTRQSSSGQSSMDNDVKL
jgi:hypothetical protein